MAIPDAVIEHYTLMQRLQTVAVVASRRAWYRINPNDLSGSWSQGVALVAGVVSTQQERAAAAGASYLSAALAEQGEYVAPDAFVNPSAFAGVAADGRPLNSLLYSPITTTKSLIANGFSVAQALTGGRSSLDTIVQTTIADTGRAAASVGITTRADTGYVRMLNPPSCARCSVLAGKFYRWNHGFQRHPQCDCVHVPSRGRDAATSEGLIHDPCEYFKSLSPAEQDRVYGAAQAKAINDGADIFQVVNAQRGMKPGGMVTTEGTSKRGNFGKNGPRLTPDAIYAKGLTREQTLAELERYGYILPGGQNPLGGIRGQAEGFGQLGRGGTRVGAREAVMNARNTGVRDPRVRATMTAAELRVFDAKSRWDDVRKGVNPFNPKHPLTPEIAARVEADYRRNVLGY